MSKVSQIRQNFHDESEKAINEQISMELHASYVYQSMAMYYDRDDVALPGFAAYFKHNSDEEREHAETFMKYLNKRGGKVVLQDVKRPEQDEWGTGLDGLQTALALELKVNQSLLNLHATGSTHNDAHLTDFIEEKFLDEQVEAIKSYGDMITKMKRAGPGLGEYLFDKDLKA